MIASTESSITMQEVEPELPGANGMSVALIGPNDGHRTIVSKALAGSDATHVREFDNYPSQDSDLLQVVAQDYDAVLIDVDSDESYALAVIESIASYGRARVVAYSRRNHPDLILNCLQAGAQDLLPLPSEEGENSGEVPPPAVAEDVDSSSEDQYTFKQQEAPAERIAREPKDAGMEDALPLRPRRNGRKQDSVTYDFTDWDARFLRPTRPEVVVPPKSEPQPIFGHKRFKKFSLRVTPIDSQPEVAVDDDVKASTESIPAAVEPESFAAQGNATEENGKLIPAESANTVEAATAEMEVEEDTSAVANSFWGKEGNAPELESDVVAVESDETVLEAVPGDGAILPAEVATELAIDEEPTAVVAIPSAILEGHLPAAIDDQADVEQVPAMDAQDCAPVESAQATSEEDSFEALSCAPEDVSLPLKEEILPIASESRTARDADTPNAQQSRAAGAEDIPAQHENQVIDEDSDPTVDLGQPVVIPRALVPIEWTAADPLHIDEDHFAPAKKYERPSLAIPVIYPTEDEQEEEVQDAWLLKWALMFTGLALVAGLLVLIAWHPFWNLIQSVFPSENAAYQMDSPSHPLAIKQAKPHSWRTILGSRSSSTDASDAAEPVSSDVMVAQLTAPAKIPVAAKRPVAMDEPPAGLSPDAIDSGASLPSAVFGKESKVQVVPGVSAISAGVATGLLLHRTEPVYPAFAREHNMSGAVLLGATITKTGAITDLHVLSGPSVFRSAAMDAVKSWRYRPYMLDNQPVAVQTTINVMFQAALH